MFDTDSFLAVSLFPKLVRILVVEDERIIALNLQEILEDMGYSVLAIASSGECALELATSQRPDIVLMDIVLGGTVDGVQAASYIWEQLQIPVIYITGHSDPATVNRAILTSPFGYVVKPIQERDLYIAIETTLRRYQREQWLSSVLRDMGDGVIVVDIECRVRYLNPLAEQMTGWLLRDALNQDFAQVFHTVDEVTQEAVAKPLMASLDQGSVVHLDQGVVLQTRQGQSIPIAASMKSLRDDVGTTVGGVCVFRDRTKQRQTEDGCIPVLYM